MNTSLPFVSATLLLAVGLLSTGCPKPGDSGEPSACTDMGCTDGLHITLEHASWEPGTWTFVLDIDGTIVTCETTLPFVESDLGGCDAADVSIGLSGTALPADQQSISEILVDRADFAAIGISIQRDGVEVATESFVPEWTVFRPNGEDCPPECTQDSATMSF